MSESGCFVGGKCEQVAVGVDGKGLTKNNFMIGLELNGVRPNELTKMHECEETCSKKCSKEELVMRRHRSGELKNMIKIGEI